MSLLNALLQNVNKGSEGLAGVSGHDFLATDLGALLILLIKGEKARAEGVDGTGSLCLQLEIGGANHQLAKNRHKFTVVLDLNVGAQLFHEGGKSAKSSVSDSLVLVLDTSAGHLHGLSQVLGITFLAGLSDQTKQQVASLSLLRTL